MKRALATILILGAAVITSASRTDQTTTTGRPDGQTTTPTLQDPALAESEPQKADELREEFHQSYALSLTGRVSLENINGGVHVEVWDQPQVKVDAVKRAYRRERLDEVTIEVTPSPDSVRIRTRYPDRDQTFSDESPRRYENPATVEYTLTVPRQARLDSIEVINGPVEITGSEGLVRASSINGRVKAQGLTGESRLSTVNGGLEAVFTRLDENKPVTLSSVNGNIMLMIPSDANAQVRASTVHGAITNEFGLPVQNGEYVGHDLNGQLGNGGPRVRLSNVNGGITIRHPGDGKPVSRATSLLPERNRDAMNDDVTGSVNDAIRAQAEANREARQARIEARKQAAEAIKESQKEMNEAQKEIQRSIVREAVRVNVRNVGRFQDRETKNFVVTGTPSVSVETFDGSVVIRGWDKSEVQCTAVKRASSDDALKSIKVDAEQHDSTIAIKAISGGDEGSTAFEIYVPRTANLNIKSNDGRLTLQGVSGELVADTGDGAIEFDGGTGRLKANTGDGHIRIVNFQGDVIATTGDGSITLDGNFTGVNARTGDGAIVLGVPSGAAFVLETNADEVTNQGVAMSQESSPSTKIKRWKIGNGGTVFSLRTGGGHVIVRSR